MIYELLSAKDKNSKNHFFLNKKEIVEARFLKVSRRRPKGLKQAAVDILIEFLRYQAQMVREKINRRCSVAAEGFNFVLLDRALILCNV